MSARIRSLRLGPRAIIYGCLASFGASMVAGIALVLVAISRNTDLASVESTMQTPGFAAAGLVVSLLAMILGGYVAARKSPGTELTNAIAVGVVLVLLGILIQILVRAPLDLWGVLGYVTTIPAAAAGGLLRVSQLGQATTTD